MAIFDLFTLSIMCLNESITDSNINSIYICELMRIDGESLFHGSFIYMLDIK